MKNQSWETLKENLWHPEGSVTLQLGWTGRRSHQAGWAGGQLLDKVILCEKLSFGKSLHQAGCPLDWLSGDKGYLGKSYLVVKVI